MWNHWSWRRKHLTELSSISSHLPFGLKTLPVRKDLKMGIMDLLKNGTREMRNRQPYIISPVCSVLTAITDPRFLFIDEKYSVRNLQEGPKTRLIRGIYIIYQKKKGNLVLILTTYLQRKKWLPAKGTA